MPGTNPSKECTSLLNELIGDEIKVNQEAVAISDHHNLTGANQALFIMGYVEYWKILKQKLEKECPSSP